MIVANAWVTQSKGVQYVGGQTASYTSTTGNKVINFALTGGLASTPAIGDYVFVGVCHAALSTLGDLAPPSGYTEICDLTGNDGWVCDFGFFYKKLTAADTSVTVAHISNNTSVVIQVYRGVDPTTPFDVTTTTATGTNTAAANPPSITPTTPGSIVVAIGASGSEYNSGVNFTSSLTSFRTVGQNGGASTNYRSNVGMGYSTWSSGALNPAAFGVGTDDVQNAWCACTIALRPG